MAYSIGSYVNILSNGMLGDQAAVSPPGGTEADSIIGKITSNFVETFNNMHIPYNGEDHIVLADFRRKEDDFSESISELPKYPFVVPQFVEGEPLQETSHSTMYDLRYVVSCYIGDINDKKPNDPISQTLKNIHAYLIKQAMVDVRRGGNATYTRKGKIQEGLIEYGSYSEYVVYIELFVKAWVRNNDPFIQAG